MISFTSSPNTLKGHEGQLVKASVCRDTCQCVVIEKKVPGYTISVPVKCARQSGIGLLVSVERYCDYHNEFNSSIVRILFKDRVCDFELRDNAWMQYFRPFPHGVFLEPDKKNV